MGIEKFSTQLRHPSEIKTKKLLMFSHLDSLRGVNQDKNFSTFHFIIRVINNNLCTFLLLILANQHLIVTHLQNRLLKTKILENLFKSQIFEFTIFMKFHFRIKRIFAH